MKTLIIIPAYNEQDRIMSVVDEIKDVTPELDYLVVNDGSTDNTSKILALNHVNHMNLPVNLGLTGATRAGIEYAYRNNYDYVIKIDGDGQHDPRAIKYMLKTMQANDLDIVQMSRYIEKRRPLTLRMIASRMITVCAFIICFKKLSDPTNGCHLYNRKIINEYHLDPNLGPEPNTICYFLKDKYKFREVQFDVRPRITGRSLFTATKSIMYMLEICISILFIVPFQGHKNKKRIKLKEKQENKNEDKAKFKEIEGDKNA